MQVEKSLGRKPKELADAPTLRNELSYLWALFVNLKNATGDTISYGEIQAYINIYCDLSTFEIDVIRTLDELHNSEANNHG